MMKKKSFEHWLNKQIEKHPKRFLALTSAGLVGTGLGSLAMGHPVSAEILCGAGGLSSGCLVDEAILKKHFGKKKIRKVI